MSTEVTKAKTTLAMRFQQKVELELSTISSGVVLNPHQKQLVQNMFFAVDGALIAAEAKRLKSGNSNQLPYTWDNINMRKLTFDAMNRSRLGLDASLPNHIHPVPYMNNKEGKYDITLMIGYSGKDHYRRKVAKDEPVDIRYELVYSTDHFKQLARDSNRSVEDYEFEVKEPFNRGDIIGGFGYISFKDKTKNKIIVVTKKDFDKVSNNGNFWKDWYEMMCYKTLVHRVTSRLEPDPMKVATLFGASFKSVEQEDNDMMFADETDRSVRPDAQEVSFDEQIDEQAGEIAKPVEEKPAKTEPPKKAPAF